MNEATLRLLERLTGNAQGRLRLLRHNTANDTIKAALALEISELDDLLDKARTELKGGK